MSSSEEDRIKRLAQIFDVADRKNAPSLSVGIGDDAAVLVPSTEPLVWTVDAAVEGSHFRRAWLSFEDIGYRSMMAAASDLAAMGAEPLGALSALVLPEDMGDVELYGIAQGQREATRALGTAVIGGNLARGRELSITTTVLGRGPAPILRSGARAGDVLWLVGPVGLAAAGLAWLSDGRSEDGESVSVCVRAWRRPFARIATGLALRGVATAAVDVSDGLARDVGHLARASGARAVIEVASLVTDPLRDVAEKLGREAATLALFGGEDYAIAVTAPPGRTIPDAVTIGRIEPIDPEELADPACVFVVAVHADGTREPIRSGGFDHFAS